MPDPRAAGVRPRVRWLVIGAFTALVVAPLVTAAVVSMFLFRPGGRTLEIEMRPTGGTAAQLFWSQGWAFSHEESSVVALHQHPGQYERVRFPLPDKPLLFLRFDPLNGPGEILIRSMRVLDRGGRTVRIIDPIVLAALHQIESIAPVGEDVRVVTTAGADDPMLLLKGSWMAPAPAWLSLQFVTPVSLAWIAGACAALIVTALAFLARDVSRGQFSARDALWLAALFVVVLWGKLALLDHYPVPVPFWDQWDGEVASLYLPYANGGLTWHQMFTLHNEHRIFFTRVLAVTLLTINGQWDPQLQIAVNAVLHSLAAVVFAVMLWLACGRRWLPLLVAILALVFAPPFALENTLAGFQSAFYFLVLFAGLAIWLMGTHRPGSWAWFLGWICAFCSIFTVGGGILTVAGIGTLIVFNAFSNTWQWRQALVNIAALGALVGVGYMVLSPPLAYHDYLKAGTWLAFKVSFARNLAFPWIEAPRSAMVLWLPLVVLAFVVLSRRLRTTGLERLTFALGAWVLLQAAALAYSRGANGAIPASRYLDMLSFGFVVNTVALLALVATRSSRLWVSAGYTALALWLAVGGLGIAQLSRNILAKEGRDKRLHMEEYLRNVRHFVVTGDAETFAEKRGPAEIPYYSAPMLAGWLSHPYVRQILPAPVRAPLNVREQAGAAAGFAQTVSPGDPLPVWDSYASGRAKSQGRFESLPLQCLEFDALRFEVAGSPRAPGMRLALKSADGRETVVRPAWASGSGWSAVTVDCPASAFTVVAADASPTAWFAFRQPTEIGWASAIAESMAERSEIIGFLAAATIFAALVLPVRPRTKVTTT